MCVPETRSGIHVQGWWHLGSGFVLSLSHSLALESRRRRRPSLPQLPPTGSGTGQHGFIALRSAVTGAHT
ncbi:hypothetical protein VTO73DRAFT_3064 [Trametes versicolor]